MTIKAEITEVQIGVLKIQGLMSEDGDFGVAVPQIAELNLIPSGRSSKQIESLWGKMDFVKWQAPTNPKAVNVLKIPDFAELCYRISVAGKDVTGFATSVARQYYAKDREKISILDGLRALEKSNHKALKSRTPAQREKDIQEKYAVLWQCEKEYPVVIQRTVGSLKMSPVQIGRADLVNDHMVVEIKKCSDWKHAMGQLLAYQEVLCRKQIWLILFAAKDCPQKEIETIVSRFGINVKFIRN
jgi:hypothetical protein